MSATNSTTYYELPVFIATDKPAWLTDWNGAMNAIDTAIKEALTAGENAQTTANTATTSIATINDSLTTINTSLSTLTSTVSGLVGSVNTINSLIGNGEPTTSDKTLIGAINEIYAMIGGGTEVDADIVAYDNTTSGLTADDVQSAIDEVVTMIGGGSNLDLSAYHGSITPTVPSGATLSESDVSYHLNSDKSIGKIFGSIKIMNIPVDSTNWTTVASLSDANLPTRATQAIIDVGYSFVYTTAIDVIHTRMVFNTDGTIDIQCKYTSSATITGLWISLNPVLHLLDQGI